jgi:hypothetical protein
VTRLGRADLTRNISIRTAEARNTAGGFLKPHLAGWTSHVYPFETDPAKIWRTGMGDDHGIQHNSM